MLSNPLIFGILCSTIITGIYTLIITKTNKDKNDNIKNNSVILFTISLIIISVGQLLITSNSDPVEILTDINNNNTSNMLTGTPNF